MGGPDVAVWNEDRPIKQMGGWADVAEEKEEDQGVPTQRRIGQGAPYRLRNGFQAGAVAGARSSAGAGPEEGLKALYTPRH